ncbi:hypothetical protein G6F65_017265 [Rhizopus arrhizus]|nr:hypothetical protein G6F65_017265 [Rhizopus arrhizus]
MRARADCALPRPAPPCPGAQTPDPDTAPVDRRPIHAALGAHRAPRWPPACGTGCRRCRRRRAPRRCRPCWRSNGTDCRGSSPPAHRSAQWRSRGNRAPQNNAPRRQGYGGGVPAA